MSATMQIGQSIFGSIIPKVPLLPTKFQAPSQCLTTREYQILRLLEHRSDRNGGDTKVTDDKLSKLMRCSPKTISRALKKFELLGYIMRMTERRIGASERANSRNQFYSIRVIRCFRTFLANGGRQRSKEELGWSTDSRPAYNVKGEVPEGYKYREVRYVGTSDDGADIVRTTKRIFLRAPGTHPELDYRQAYEDNVLDEVWERENMQVEEMWELGDPFARALLGYKPKV